MHDAKQKATISSHSGIMNLFLRIPSLFHLAASRLCLYSYNEYYLYLIPHSPFLQETYASITCI